MLLTETTRRKRGSRGEWTLLFCFVGGSLSKHPGSTRGSTLNVIFGTLGLVLAAVHSSVQNLFPKLYLQFDTWPVKITCVQQTCRVSTVTWASAPVSANGHAENCHYNLKTLYNVTCFCRLRLLSLRAHFGSLYVSLQARRIYEKRRIACSLPFFLLKLS